MFRKLHASIFFLLTLNTLLLSGFTFSSHRYVQEPPERQSLRESALTRIIDEKKVRVGVKVDFPPFGSVDATGNHTGFDIDLATEFSRRWLGDHGAIEFVPVTADDAIPLLRSTDRIDFLLAGMTHTWQRDQEIDFSQIYFLDGQGLLVLRESEVQTIDDLQGQRVAVREGSTAEKVTCTNPTRKLRCTSYPNTGQALDALHIGNAQAFLSDSISLSTLANDCSDQEGDLSCIDLKVVTDPITGNLYTFTHEPYAIGVRQGDSALRELLNATLQAMKQDGMYDTLFFKWFPTRVPYPIHSIPGDASYLLADLSNANLTDQYSRIDLIRARGNVLIAGVKDDFPPFGSYDTNGNRSGFDVELVKAIAKEWGVQVHFVSVTSANRIDLLRRGTVDILAATMTHNWLRDEKIDFSQTYFSDGQSFLVRQDSGFNGIEDLDGKIIAAIQGSTAIDNLRLLEAQYDITFEVVPYTTIDDVILDLTTDSLTRRIHAFITDSVLLSQRTLEYPELKVLDKKYTNEPYGLGLPENDFHFMTLVNCTLQKLKLQSRAGYNELWADSFSAFQEQAVPYAIEVFPGEHTCNFNGELPDIDLDSSKVETIRNGTDLLQVGVRGDFAPFGFKPDGALAGFDIDIAREFASRWYGAPKAIQLIEVTAKTRIPKLIAHEIDFILAGMTHKIEREDLVDFSQTYFLDGQQMLVRSDRDLNLPVSQATIGTLEGSTADENRSRIRAELFRSFGIGDDLTFQRFTTTDQALRALRRGDIYAFVSDGSVLAYHAQLNPELVVSGGAFSREPYGIGVPKYDADFRQLINYTLQEMQRDGTYANLYCKWFGSNDEPHAIELWPTDPTKEAYLEINIKQHTRVETTDYCQLHTPPDSVEPPDAQNLDLAEAQDVPLNNGYLYTVAIGDTLSQIAGELYGNQQLWWVIHDDNRDIIGDDPNTIEVGMKLRIRKNGP